MRMHACTDVHRLTKVPSASVWVLNNGAWIPQIASGIVCNRRDVLQQRLLVGRE